MAYMSYCRFEGTASDFGECIEDLKKGKVLNQYEEPYRHTLYKMAKEYIKAYENYTPKPDDDDDEEED